jgi:hypothetical protein
VRASVVCSLLTLLLMSAPAMASRGVASDEPPHWVVSEVREVDRLQGRLVLTDGKEVWATNPQQLDQLVEGSKVRLRFEIFNGRRMIYSVERLGS